MGVDETKKLKLLGSGTYGIAFKGCFDKNKECISVKLLKVSNNYVDSLTHPSNIEFIIGDLLSSLVINDVSPHINMTYFTTNCKISNFDNDGNIYTYYGLQKEALSNSSCF